MFSQSQDLAVDQPMREQQQGNEPLLHRISSIAVPVGLESIFQMAFTFIDQVIVGALGTIAVAAVGLSTSIAFVLICMFSSIGAGCGILIAQAFGRRDMREVSLTLNIGQALVGAIGVLTALPLVLFAEHIMRAVGASDGLAQTAGVYFRIYALSVPFMVISAVTSAGFRSMGDSKTPMKVTIAAVVLNTVLGYLLVFGLLGLPKMGVGGAALATLISQAFRTIALVIILYTTRPGIRWNWPHREALAARYAGELVRLAYPLTINEIFWGMSGFLYAVIYTQIGTDALAANQIIMATENIFIVASNGLPVAAVTLVGAALGSGSIAQARAIASKVIRIGVYTALVSSVLVIGSAFLLPIFYPQIDRSVLNLSFYGIILVSFFLPAKVSNSVMGNGVLPSGKDTRFVLFATLAGQYLVGIPGGLLLGVVFHFGFWGIFFARIGEEFVKITLFILRYRTPKWHDRTLPIIQQVEQPANG